MTRKYICDNCGKEVEHKEFYQVEVLDYFDRLDNDLGEFCEDCIRKIEKFIEDGFKN